MAPRTSYRESASESEAKPSSNLRGSNKARNMAAQQAQQEFLTKHINSNGPQDKPKVQPLDFTSLDLKTLNHYNERYGLNLPKGLSLNEDILSSEIGKKSHTYKHTKDRISKLELAGNVKKHFMSLPVRENETIANFLYKVKHEDEDFKLTFK